MSSKLYEDYHKSSGLQSRVINPDNFTYKYILEIIEEHLSSNKVKKILDIGCGSGTLSFYLSNKNHEVKGIDISDKAIKVCKESSRLMNLKNISFERIDFPNKAPKGKYDFVIFSEVIEHLADDDLALKKIYSLLNHGGLLFLTTPSNNAPLYRLGTTKEFDKRVGHERRYSINQLVKKLKKQGFFIENIYKKESLLRNFLFINPIAGKLIRFIKFFLVDIFMLIDDFLVKLFGESQIIIVAQKR